MYGAIVYLTTKLAEPETETTKALVNGCEDVETISLWIIVAHCFQSVFAISASLKMISAPDYDLYAFKNYCLAFWNCVVSIPSMYSRWRSVAFPSWFHNSVWFGDWVMLSLIFRAFSGAASIVIIINFDLHECPRLQTCSIFVASSFLMFVSYFFIQLPASDGGWNHRQGGCFLLFFLPPLLLLSLLSSSSPSSSPLISMELMGVGGLEPPLPPR
ncbi:uncharacterized protein LOC120651184 isoform X1 [Panicum virgatum]|uniref:uncharacterized protein LOC120651184 isoform X1 n=1 Tax=Panicum virgatum TaxID=38727 RepID=UPI0019D5D4E2|nr:uncharacterized protein LOC120651184 isoform X1 [Panicum virgatum]